jgi:ketosteroid isomerase-like protein
MDLERVTSFYSPDIVSFDIVPPLWYEGAENKRRHWEDAFSAYRSLPGHPERSEGSAVSRREPLGYDIRNVTVTVRDDIAFVHSLNAELEAGTAKLDLEP